MKGPKLTESIVVNFLTNTRKDRHPRRVSVEHPKLRRHGPERCLINQISVLFKNIPSAFEKSEQLLLWDKRYWSHDLPDPHRSHR